MLGWRPWSSRGMTTRRVGAVIAVLLVLGSVLGGYRWWSHRPATLTVTVTGLAEGVPADVLLRGGGVDRHLTGTLTLSVPPGRYVLRGLPVRGTSSDLYPVLGEAVVQAPAGGSPKAEVEYADEVPHTTKVLDPGSFGLVGAATDEPLVFAPGSAPARTLAAGDVLVAGIGPATPEGLMRKVTATGRDDRGRVLVSTAPATIRDAMPRGKIDVKDVALRPYPGPGQQLAKPATMTLASLTDSAVAAQPSASAGGNPFSFDGDPGTFTINAALRKETVAPGAELECQKAVTPSSAPLVETDFGAAAPRLDFALHWDLGGVHGARWTIKTTQKSGIRLEIPHTIDLKKCALKFQDPQIPVPVGEFVLPSGSPFPLVFVMKASGVGLLEASFAKLDLALDVDQEAKLTAGLDWAGSGLPRPIASFDNSFTLRKGPKATIEVAARAGVRLDMDLYGVAGPFLDTTLGLKLSGQGGGNSANKAELKAGIYTSAGLGLDFWGRKDLSVEISDLFHVEKSIWSVLGPTPPAPSPSSAPATATPALDPAAPAPCPSDAVLRAALGKQISRPGPAWTIATSQCWNGWAAVTWGPEATDDVTISVFRRDHEKLTPAVVLVPSPGAEDDPGWLRDCRTLQALNPPAALTDAVGCPKQPAPGDFDSDSALAKIRELGYSADPDSAHGLQGPLRAIRASSTGGDGSVQGVFLFHGNQYVGRDTNPVDGAVAITGQNGRTVTIEYRTYRPDDPRCCPSGGTTTLRASWDGTRIVWTPPPNVPAP